MGWDGDGDGFVKAIVRLLFAFLSLSSVVVIVITVIFKVRSNGFLGHFKSQYSSHTLATNLRLPASPALRVDSFLHSVFMTSAFILCLFFPLFLSLAVWNSSKRVFCSTKQSMNECLFFCRRWSRGGDYNLIMDKQGKCRRSVM